MGGSNARYLNREQCRETGLVTCKQYKAFSLAIGFLTYNSIVKML